MIFDKKTKIIIFTAFAVFILFYGMFMSIGAVCSKFYTTEDIEKIINNDSKFVVDFDNFRLKSTYDLCFEVNFKNLSILLPDNKKEFLKLENTSIKISALPLIIKKLNLKKFISTSIYVDILMDKNGHFEFEKYLDNQKFDVNLAKTDINIDKYFINFDDEMYSITHKIEGKNLISYKLSNKNLNVKTEANLYSGNTESFFTIDISTKLPFLEHIDDKDFNFDLHANNINLKSLHPYFKKAGIINESR